MSVTSGTKSESGFGETVRVIIHALLIALVIRTFLFQPFNIPSGSMKATLLVGDYLFVSKYSYGYSHYSIPFSPPLFSGRIFGSEPSRGDIVVFRLPKDDSTDYIKRVIGLPGDRIQMKDGLLYINDVPVKRERLVRFHRRGALRLRCATARVKRWKETLPNGVTYETLDCVDNGFYDNTNRLHRAGRPFLHDGRQPRQLDRQPRAVGGRLRAVPEHHRPRPDDLLLDRRGRSTPGCSGAGRSPCAGIVSSPSCDERRYARHPEVDRHPATQASSPTPQAKLRRRRSRARGAEDGGAEFDRDAASGTNSPSARVLVTAFTHVSALNPAKRHRADSYQRMEFLGDHVLGLVVSDMLYQGVSAGRRGRIVKAPGRSRAQGDLRRCGASRSGLPRTSSSAPSAIPPPRRGCASPCSATSARP